MVCQSGVREWSWNRGEGVREWQSVHAATRCVAVLLAARESCACPPAFSHARRVPLPWSPRVAAILRSAVPSNALGLCVATLPHPAWKPSSCSYPSYPLPPFSPPPKNQRRLWEAGQSSGGQPVVGLVSASTLPDIRKLWPAAGSPAIQARAEEYLQDPGMQAPGAGVVGFAVPALSLAMIGIMAYRRPRVAAYVFGGLAAISAPSILLQLVAMNRFASFTDRLERVARDLDAGGPGGDSFSFGEWQ